MQKNKEVINESGILKIIVEAHEELQQINGTKRLHSDKRVVEEI